MYRISWCQTYIFNARQESFACGQAFAAKPFLRSLPPPPPHALSLIPLFLSRSVRTLASAFLMLRHVAYLEDVALLDQVELTFHRWAGSATHHPPCLVRIAHSQTTASSRGGRGTHVHASRWAHSQSRWVRRFAKAEEASEETYAHAPQTSRVLQPL